MKTVILDIQVIRIPMRQPICGSLEGCMQPERGQTSHQRTDQKKGRRPMKTAAA
jgi:hypothetical protein